MKTVLIANPKGGSGKTTLATNLAGALAERGERVALWDLDRQHSSLQWLAIRPAERPTIYSLDSRIDGNSRLSRHSGWLVLDSPAGLHGKNLGHAIRLAQKIVVPVQPSMFDMAATGEFFSALVEEVSQRHQKASIGVVGMRVDPRTRAASTLEAFLTRYQLPILTLLRDTQVYVNAAFNGLSIFDLPDYLRERDVEQWQPILDWVDASE